MGQYPNDTSVCFLHEIKRSALLSEQFIYRMRKTLSEGKLDALDDILDRMEAATSGMLVFINSTMLAERVHAGTLALNPVLLSLSELVKDSLDLFNIRFKLSGVTIVSELNDESSLVSVDPAIFPSVVHNLIDNALKYSVRGSVVEVKTWHENDSIFLSVKNSGYRINEDEKSKIFTKHYRGENTASISGSGLGLYITKSIIDDHKGEVSVSSVNGETEFVISLPCMEQS